MNHTGVDIFSLAGKTALITGATGYLGTAMAHILAEAGAHVILNSRSESRCNALLNELQAKGYSVERAVFDVTSKAETTKFCTSIRNRPLHILINNAYAGGGGTVETATDDQYLDSFNMVMVASQRLLSLLLPNLRQAVELSGDASVINISSMYGMVSPDFKVYDTPESTNPPFYGAAKASLIQWSRYAACEFGKEGIRINSVAFGPFPATSVQESMPQFVSELSQKVPLARIGYSDEVKGPILFLASQASSYVTGSNLVVDGGWTSR